MKRITYILVLGGLMLSSHGDKVVMGTGTWGMRDKFKFYQKNLEV